MEKKESEIISKLYVKEDDVLKQTEQIIAALQPHVGIEPISKKIVIKNENLVNRDKIGCYLVAKYFMKKQGLVSDSSADIQELEKELGIVKTTLSAPLKQLVDDRFLDRENGKYAFKFHKITEFVATIKV